MKKDKGDYEFGAGMKGRKKTDSGWSQEFGVGGNVMGGFDAIQTKQMWDWSNDLDDFSQDASEIQELNSMLEFENSFNSETY
jgi:hypothetical protein